MPSVTRSARRWWLISVASMATVAATVLAFVLWNPSGINSAPPVHQSSPTIGSLEGSAGTAPTAFSFLDQPRALPTVRFVDGAGKVHTLVDLRGHPLVLNIWATWCIPCRKEMPTLDRLQAVLRGSDALVVPLSIDSKGRPAVAAFYKEVGIKSLGIYVNQPGDAAQLLDAVGIPTTLLVDRDGREIGRKIGPAEWDSPEMVALIRSHLKPQPIGTGDDQHQ